MKKFFVIIILALVANAAVAQFQIYTRISEKITPEYDFNFYGQKLLTKHVGIWGFALVEQKWAEAYGGLLYSPAKWVEITVGAGIEQCDALYRLSANVFLSGKNFSFLLATEKGDGRDNWWYKSFLKYQVGKWNFGIQSWRFHVTGPIVEYSPLSRLKIWVNPGRDLEFGINRITAGVDVKVF